MPHPDNNITEIKLNKMFTLYSHARQLKRDYK